MWNEATKQPMTARASRDTRVPESRAGYKAVQGLQSKVLGAAECPQGPGKTTLGHRHQVGKGQLRGEQQNLENGLKISSDGELEL